MVRDDKILLLKHRKLGVWLPPGGHVEPGETPLDTVHREVKEESGYKIKIINPYADERVLIHDEGIADEQVRPLVIFLEYVKFKDGNHTHFDMIYLAEPGNSLPVPAESSNDMKWFNKEEIEKLDTYPNCKRAAIIALEKYNGTGRPQDR